MINISSFIRFHALRTPDRTAMIFGGQSVSYKTFMDRIEHCAGLLAASGVGPDDVVAVLMKNSAAFLDVAFAASHVGAIFLPINFRLSPDEVSYILSNSGAKLLFVDEELKGAAETFSASIVVTPAAQKDIRALPSAGKAPEMVFRNPADLFRLMYTSGTTDRPKGVMHTYQNFYWKCSDHAVVLGINADTKLLVVGPLYHVGAFDLPGVAVLWMGGTLLIERDFQPEAVLGAIQREKLNAAWLAPVMTGALLTFAERDKFDVSSLRWVVGGGERTPESRIRSFSDYFRSARYIDAYGLTESGSGDTFMEAGREFEKIGSTGRGTPNVDIDIRDDSGVSLGAGEVGEICLRGPKITKGYWKDPAKTAASFFGDWFRTGDVGYLDDEGFLFITDRKKDMIISGGENISSSEVERVIYELPQIQEAAVIGVPDERWGELPVAVVVLAKGASLDVQDLITHCKPKLAGFKIPKTLLVRESLPRNPSGKILKRILRTELGYSS